MRKLRLFVIATLTLAMPLVSTASSKVKKDTITTITKQVDLLGLDISINLDKKWEVSGAKKSKTITLKHADNNSEIEISSMKLESALDSIFTSKTRKEVKSLVESAKSKKNLKVELSYSKEDSKTKKGFEYITLHKIINQQAFFITARIDPAHKQEFDLIIESIKVLE